MKPLSEKELREKVDGILQDLVFDTPNHYGYPPDFEPDFKGTTDKLVNLVLSDRKAHEIFIPVKGLEGLYEVSNTGKVRSVIGGRRSGSELKLYKESSGYIRVGLTKNGVTKKHWFHRVVATSFLSNPENKPCVNHIDGNPENNHLYNLEWCTHQENARHSFDVLGKEAWHKGTAQYEDITCKGCSKEFRQLKKRRAMFCSRDCFYLSRRKANRQRNQGEKTDE